MKYFQDRFLFYLNRCEKLLNCADTVRSEVRPYTEEEFNIACAMLFEMCFTNYRLTTGDEEAVESEKDFEDIYEYKRHNYAEGITEVIKKVILEDMF